MRLNKSIILLIFLVVSSLPLFAQDIPDSIRRARSNLHEDIIVGIGVAKAESDWDSISLAETLARAQISEVLESSISKPINEYYSLSDEVTGVTMNRHEEFVVQLSTSHIMGSWIAELEKTSDETWWCVVYFDKGIRATEQAQAAARMAVQHYLFQREAEDRMNEAFERASEDKED